MDKVMTTLLHPATAFIQSLQYTEVAFGDMTPIQQETVWELMDCDGDGVWAEHIGSRDGAKLMFADVRFGVGKFANDDKFLSALYAAEASDEVGMKSDKWLSENLKRGDGGKPCGPVVLQRADYASEFGMFVSGYLGYFDYWSHLPETEFICFLPDWDVKDPSGRGGQ